MDVDFTIVEKDFWVCWTLKTLFALPGEQPKLTFKGGTSLSKAYGIIDRFSEDIDVAADPQFFIDQGSADPEERDVTKTQREKRMERLDVACAGYIARQLLPLLRVQFAERLGGEKGWDLLPVTSDPNSHKLCNAAIGRSYPRRQPVSNPLRITGSMRNSPWTATTLCVRQSPTRSHYQKTPSSDRRGLRQFRRRNLSGW